jgi:ferritin-like protein
MRNTIVELMEIPAAQHNLDWLKAGLQAALELELATLPPYLCGLWSIKLQSGPVYDLVKSAVLEEMLHMGLACNMLAAIGGKPGIVGGYQRIAYPGPLPGGVRPQLTVYLAGLTKDYVRDVYMKIEYPESGPIAMAVGESYPTIGAFYDAILDAFEQLSPQISEKNQLTADFRDNSVYMITSVADAKKAITEIKKQGEGTSQTPFAMDPSSEFAHYYKYAEIYHGKALIQVNGKWRYKGDAIPFPEVYPMARVPARGYQRPSDPAKQALQAFDQQFTTVLDYLDSAWATGNQSMLNNAVGAMFALQHLANSLMQIPLPSTRGVYGPDFKLVSKPH